MNYELAKQLKDAGFPQIASGYSGWFGVDNTFYRINDMGNYKGINTNREPPEEKDLCFSPTLAQLIVVCGDELGSIIQMQKGRWRCTGMNYEGFDNVFSTPEEAVANLWLELNKDDTDSN